MTRRAFVAGGLVWAAVAEHPLNIHAQDNLGSNQGITSAPAIPAFLLYHHFFRQINFLDQKASEAESAGSKGDDLRKYYQKKLGLTDAEHNALLKRAAGCEDEVRKQDDAATKLIEQVRAAYPDGKIPNGVSFPMPPAELAQMQAQRDAIIQKHMAQLKTDMGTAGFLKADSFVNGEFAKHISIHSLPARAKRVGHIATSESPLAPAVK